MKTVQLSMQNSCIQKINTAIYISMICVFLFACKKENALMDETSVANGQASEMNALKAIVVHNGGSIQAAVNAAKPGNTIKIEPGTYTEAILVSKAGIKLIGLTKNGAGVIIKNPGDEENGITVTDQGDGFVIENITIKNFEENGIFLDHVDNFRIEHVVAINNGEYGIFPVHSSNGVITNCIATGHSDTGIYVGQSSNVKMQSNEAYGNVTGLEVENSSNVIVADNKSHNNVEGILIDLLPGKEIKTSSNVRVTGNHVFNNNHKNFGEPGELESYIPKGIGILVLGTDNTTVENNLVTGNNFTGIVVFSTLVLGVIAGIPPENFDDIEPNPDGAKICHNELRKNGAMPPDLPIELPGVDLLWDGSGVNNCWSNNIFATSYPSPLPVCN